MRVTVDGRPVRFPLAGVGQYTANLALALQNVAAPEVDTTVLLFDGLIRANWDARRLARRLESVRVRRSRLMPRQLFTAWLRYAASTMPHRVAGGTFDVWHSTYFEAWPTMSSQQRLVSTIHDVIFLTHPHLFAARNLAASQFALARQVSMSHHVIAVSDYTRQQLLLHTKIPPDRVSAIPLAGSASPVPEPEAALFLERISLNRPFVLYVGSLEPRKDVRTLLEAWRTSRARRDYALVLAGAPAYLASPTVAAIASLAETADVRWLGYVPERAKAALLQKATAFVYPSVYEGFGLPVLEAVSFGLPVIACDTSSIPQAAGPGAILIEPSNPAQLERAIDRLLGDPALQHALAAKGKEHAAKFSWARVARETIAVYTAAYAQ